VEMAKQAGVLHGIDVDPRAVSYGQRLVERYAQIVTVQWYDGQTIPYDDNSFDIVTCIDVLEHVRDYMVLLREMIRVSSRAVFVSTPNRRSEFTRPNGKPKNRWHLREWSLSELEHVMQPMPAVRVEWNCLDGPWEGPFECRSVVSEDTLALAPALLVEPSRLGGSLPGE